MGICFLVSLFTAYIIAKICLVLDKNRVGVMYVIATLLLYRMGYYYHNTGTNDCYLTGFAHYLSLDIYIEDGNMK